MTVPGKVYLVGAGPGDARLLTIAGAEAVRHADVIVYDYLACGQCKAFAPATAKKIFVGKQAAAHAMEQDQINALLFDLACKGNTVVRLKGGDPYIFGRGSEEALFLVERGIEIEVIPGIPAAIGAAAYAGIPLSDRNVSSSITFVTGHEDGAKTGSSIKWEHLAKGSQTIVFYMGAATIAFLMNKLMEHGRSPDMPVSVIQWATLPNQRVVNATISTIAACASAAGITAPALTIVGYTNRMRDALNWFEKKPLFARKIIVTRSRLQASSLNQSLQTLGAEVIEAPMIETTAPDSWDRVDKAIITFSHYDWVVFTSANGVDFFFDRLKTKGRDSRIFAETRIASIGPGTSARLMDKGIIPDLQPDSYTSESLFEELTSIGQVKGNRLLLLRADLADGVLRQRLQAEGASVNDVVVYKTTPCPVEPDQLKALFGRAGRTGVTFTSSSTVRFFTNAIGEDFLRKHREWFHGFSIGPQTTRALRSCGIEPAAQAREYTIKGLVEAIVGFYSSSKGEPA